MVTNKGNIQAKFNLALEVFYNHSLVGYNQQWFDTRCVRLFFVKKRENHGD